MKKILIILFSFLSLVGFTQELKYTNPRKIVEKVNNTQGKIFNVLDYGAKGDSTTLDQTSCQNTINACQTAGGGVVYFPKGKYRVNYLSVTKDVNLIGDNAKLIGTTTSVNHYIIEVVGHLVKNTTLTGNALIGDDHVHATSTAFAAGDYIVIADTTYRYTTYGRNQEFNRVLSVSSGVINLSRPLIGNYTTANTARVYKYSPVKNTKIEGLTIQNITGNYGGGILLDYCYNVKVNNCNFLNAYDHSCIVWRSTEITISNNTVNDNQNIADSHGYGFIFNESSHHCLLTGNYTESIRENNCTNNTRFIRIINNIFKNSLVDGFNTHGSGCSYIDIIGNTIEGGCSASAGIDVGGTLAIDSCINISNNRIINVQTHGIHIASTALLLLKNIIVKNNDITNFGLTTAGSDYGIYMDYSNDSEISGNNINGVGDGGDYGIFVDTVVRNIISNNNIKRMIGGYGVGINDCDYVLMSKNVIVGSVSYNLRSFTGNTHIIIDGNITDDDSNDLLGTETVTNNVWIW
jgi:parallel beta-helix repeat protein